MTDNKAVKSYVDDLFRFIDLFENNYGSFEAEAFIQTYNGIGAVFQALRQQRNEAVEIDYYFLDKIQQSPLTSSDLRQVTVQVLITLFEAEADIDGRSNQAYAHVRGLRPVKQDVAYFEKHLVPLLFRPASLNNNFRLNSFLMGEMARFLNAYGSPLPPTISPEEFGGFDVPVKVLTLQRRRLGLGNDVMADRASLEFHLGRVNGFDKLGQKDPLALQYLKQWGYLTETSFWSRVKSALGGLWDKFKGAFASFGYFRLVLTQRNAAYLFYGVIIVVSVLAAIYAPMKWSSYGQERFEQLENHAADITGKR